MFEPADFNRDAELRDFFKFLIKIAFFFSFSVGHVIRFIYIRSSG